MLGEYSRRIAAVRTVRRPAEPPGQPDRRTHETMMTPVAVAPPAEDLGPAWKRTAESDQDGAPDTTDSHESRPLAGGWSVQVKCGTCTAISIPIVQLARLGLDSRV